MDLKQLWALVTIAETGNLRRAAELLQLVQPAVSRQLRLLEDDVGVRLFRRERHGMALTDASRALLPEPLWVVGPASAGLQADRPVPLGQLARRPLLPPNGLQGQRTLVDHACALAGVGLTAVAETNAIDAQKALVLGGRGWTVLPPISFSAELDAGLLSGAPPTDPRIERTIALALPAHRNGGAHAVRVAAPLEDCARSAVAQGRWPEARWVGPSFHPGMPKTAARNGG